MMPIILEMNDRLKKLEERVEELEGWSEDQRTVIDKLVLEYGTSIQKLFELIARLASRVNTQENP